MQQAAVAEVLDFLGSQQQHAGLEALLLAVELQDRHATVRFDAVVTGGAGALLPQSGQVYDVTTAWRLQGDEWRLVSAEWSPGLDGH